MILHGADVENESSILKKSLCQLFGDDFLRIDQVNAWVSRKSWLLFLARASNLCQDSVIHRNDQVGHVRSTSVVTFLNIFEMCRHVCEYL